VDTCDGYGRMCPSSHFDKSLGVEKVAKKLKPGRQSDFELSNRQSAPWVPEISCGKAVWSPFISPKATASYQLLWLFVFSRRGCRTL